GSRWQKPTSRIPHVWIKTRLKPRWVPHVLPKTCAKRDALARRVLEGADRRRVAIEGLLLDQIQRAIVRRVEHRLGDVRMEMRASALAHLRQGNIERHALSVRTVRGHSVDRVGRADDPRAHGKALSRLAVGIAFAVEALVVRADDDEL